MARAKLLTAARETNCGVWSSKPSAGDFTLKRFPFTHCPFHQSEGPQESRHPEQLPSDPASSCWFILFGHFREDGAAFDRSGSRTWMRSLASQRGRISQLEKRLKLPLAGVAVPVLHSCCWRGCHIHRDMWKMAHFGVKEGPFMQSQFHQADRNSSIPLFMQLCPQIKLHQPSCSAHASIYPLCRSTPTSSECAKSLRWVSHSPGRMGEVKRHEGARNPEFHLPAVVIGAKPRCFHGSEEGPVM